MIAIGLMVIFVGALVFFKPSPESLKAPSLSYWQNTRAVSGSLLAGIFVLLVYFFTADSIGLVVDEHWYHLLASSNRNDDLVSASYQLITSSFIHSNFLHVSSNVLGLALLSIYERRVGLNRYLAVLLVGIIVSSPSAFFYSEPLTVCGISGGVFALGAAFCTDHENLSIKEWLSAILLFVAITAVLMFDSYLNGPQADALTMEVDHIGHALGALGGIIYCRLFRLKDPQVNRLIPK